MSRILRKDDDIFLVGPVSEKIIGSKLPSKRQALSLLFFWLRKKETARASANFVIESVFKFWAKSRVPTQRRERCIKKLEELYDELNNLKNSRNRSSARDVSKRDTFVKKSG